MAAKDTQTLTPCNLATVPLPEEDGVVYIAIKGSLHSSDCTIFGLNEKEGTAISKKFKLSGAVPNGLLIKASVLESINSLAQLGYRVIASTGETEITWTLQREL